MLNKPKDDEMPNELTVDIACEMTIESEGD